MNDFSMVCRVLGTLFYRPPQDSLLAPLLVLIREGKLAEYWPLEQGALLERLRGDSRPEVLADDYAGLFVGDAAEVSPLRSAWLRTTESEARDFLQQAGMVSPASPADHFGALLLAGSWLEDHAAADEVLALSRLFDVFLLPWSDGFLSKVETSARSDFYRALATMTREALQALREDLDDDGTR
ncbi:molecular chaperone [Martelella alba]|uniref:Molecular chaperone n=2 Tax=Martelella alba TaxID=2590451 RepID=A0ABY2SQU9_9HYPH|nr:molecular chaperone [Martelella alba]